MFREMHLLYTTLIFFLVVVSSSFITTKVVLKLNPEDLTIEEGIRVVLYREPLINNLTFFITQEMVQPDGKTCFAPNVTRTFEKTRGKSVSFDLNKNLLPCVQENSIYRVTYQYGILHPYTIEVRVTEDDLDVD